MRAIVGGNACGGAERTREKYCAVCHTDTTKSWGLSLEHYDAAKRDLALATMMLSKLNNGANGCSG
jgi:hypothetical protein